MYQYTNIPIYQYTNIPITLFTMNSATELTFTLPHGYVDEHRRIHRVGRMRMATVMDEIAPNHHPLVRENESYALVLLMSRVITHLGEMSPVPPAIIENLYAADMAYLEDIYLRLNAPYPVLLDVDCPQCHSHWQVQAGSLARG
ncbi:MAG: hypothetical protein V9G20_26725 [Candidatus Promineifilaceae bacterium]